MPELDGQRIIVLGGSSGIGYAVAQRSLEQGGIVTITGRDADRLSSAASRLGSVDTAGFDVNDLDALGEFFSGLDTAIDHVFVGAGSPHYDRLKDVNVSNASATVANSVALTLTLAKTVAPLIRPRGTLLLMGGTAARNPAPGMSIINATMGSTTALIKTLALEIAPTRINQIAAGFVDTPLSARLLGDALEQRRADLREQLPIARVVTADDVAALAVHIMANTALTGAVFDIDGGQHLLPPVSA
jgi:NAD(P)-dependent dehydrogenase (short-subunit alcohol dehydrogenase family)